MKTLKNRLEKKIETCYLVQGEDVLLYDKALEMILEKANVRIREFNLVVFDDDTFDPDRAINACETLPMGSERKVVLFKNLSKINENFKKKLQNYVKKPVFSTILVVFDFFNKFDFLICEKISAKRLDEKTLSEIVKNELLESGKNITINAVSLLIERCCSYYSLINGELQKLKNCDENMIDEKLIEKLTCKETEFAVFELTEALSQKNASRAVSLLNLMDKDTKTFNLILSHFRRMFFASTSDLSDRELAEHLGVKEYAITKARMLSKNFSKLQLKNIYEMLSDTDLAIKNGQMQIENALFYVVFGILYA